MATVVFTAVGAVFGGPVGAIIGAAIGSQVDAELFKGSDRYGPRLQDLTVSTSVYGAALPRHFGQMRVGGSIIWATDMVEHASTSSSGKGRPSVTQYSYTASFAVALGSRPVLGIGRIWADGKLLRGAAGDMKVGGTLRIHNGYGDQAVDPLIAAHEGTGACPAYRGLAYAVFEDLQLAEFGNRIPGLSFEVFCDEGDLSLDSLFEDVLPDVTAAVPLSGILGYTGTQSLVDTLAQFQPVMPMRCDAGGDRLLISSEATLPPPILVGEPAISTQRGDFGGKTGFSRSRAPAMEAPPRVMRYYDVDLDYQAGSQRAGGKSFAGHPRSVDLPACLTGTDAFRMISKAARNQGWARDTIAWRCAELDPAVLPGSVVRLTGLAGLWRVDAWEWRSAGVELNLHRISPDNDMAMAAASSGQALLASDLALAPTIIDAFELPWDGQISSGAEPLYAALSSSGAGWKGAALFVDPGNGQLTRIGSSSRQRATVGQCQSILAPASVNLIDRSSAIVVTLADPSMGLSSATPSTLAQGANKALIGNELIQFGMATALGGGQWRLEHLWRGRGGTEGAIGGHITNERFVLLDEALVALDPSMIGSSALVRIAAIGLGDSGAVETSIVNRGIGLRPLVPVHPKALTNSAGDLSLSWTRRARGAWEWKDGVEVPLQEETEAYQVGYGPTGNPLGLWSVSSNGLTVPAATVAGLHSALAGGAFWVKQIGTQAMSDALHLTTLN